MTCTRPGDLAVRASLGSLTVRVFVRCRPVQYVRIPGPLQFILGDSEMNRPLPLPVEAYGADSRRVVVFAGSADVLDSGVATLRGLILYPRARGITLAGAYIGDRTAAIGVHIYQRVSTPTALDTLLRCSRSNDSSRCRFGSRAANFFVSGCHREVGCSPCCVKKIMTRTGPPTL